MAKYKLWHDEHPTGSFHYVLKKIMDLNSRFAWVICAGPYNTVQEAKTKMEALNDELTD